MVEPASRISRSLSHGTSDHHLCRYSPHGSPSGKRSCERACSLTLEQQGSSPEPSNNEMTDSLTSGEQDSSSILHNLDRHSSPVVPLLADAEHEIYSWISSNSRGPVYDMGRIQITDIGAVENFIQVMEMQLQRFQCQRYHF